MNSDKLSLHNENQCAKTKIIWKEGNKMMWYILSADVPQISPVKHPLLNMITTEQILTLFEKTIAVFC